MTLREKGEGGRSRKHKHALSYAGIAERAQRRDPALWLTGHWGGRISARDPRGAGGAARQALLWWRGEGRGHAEMCEMGCIDVGGRARR